MHKKQSLEVFNIWAGSLIRQKAAGKQFNARRHLHRESQPCVWVELNYQTTVKYGKKQSIIWLIKFSEEDG